MCEKLSFKCEVEVVESIGKLSSEDGNLLRDAVKASERAYAPYSEFKVGVAVKLQNGKIIKGSNQENIAYPSAICAERVALYAAAAQYPGISIQTIAITARSDKFSVNEPVSPCGPCRQVMAEYEILHKKNIRILLMGEGGKIHIVSSARSLLPFLFNEEGLKK